MLKKKVFPLRIAGDDRRRARRLALHLGLSENRLYSELIQEGLLLREQLSYLEKLRSLRVPAAEGLAILAAAPDVPPAPEDALPTSPRRKLR